MKVLFLGAYGKNYNIFGGEVVKSRIIKAYLEKNYDTKTVDLYWERKNNLQYFWNITVGRAVKIVQIIFWGKVADRIIISKTDATYVKLLNFFSLSKKIAIFGVGGRVHKLLFEQVSSPEFWNKLQGIYVESEHMVSEFHKLGVNNVKYIPNFKPLPEYSEVYFRDSEEKLKLFYIGKICEEKGCNDLISAVNHLNSMGINCHLNLYGSVDDSFDINICINENIEYQGTINLIDSFDDYDKLRKEDIFVFPTKWIGEGFAGVIIDAMSIGKPIIATRHNVNGQIVEEDKFGVLYEPGNIYELEEKIRMFYENRNLLELYGEEALKKSKDYDVNSVMQTVFFEWK